MVGTVIRDGRPQANNLTNITVQQKLAPYLMLVPAVACVTAAAVVLYGTSKNTGMAIRKPEITIAVGAFLIPNLEKRFNKKPVHSLAEIEQLHQQFPNQIKQFNVYYKDEIVAGTTIFETKTVAHAQYISATENKQELGSLDVLFHHLIHTVFKEKRYFDFGISNENQGQNINEGLLYWKESFGARTITQDFYSLHTANHNLLDAVLL